MDALRLICMLYDRASQNHFSLEKHCEAPETFTLCALHVPKRHWVPGIFPTICFESRRFPKWFIAKGNETKAQGTTRNQYSIHRRIGQDVKLWESLQLSGIKRSRLRNSLQMCCARICFMITLCRRPCFPRHSVDHVESQKFPLLLRAMGKTKKFTNISPAHGLDRFSEFVLGKFVISIYGPALLR